MFITHKNPTKDNKTHVNHMFGLFQMTPRWEGKQLLADLMELTQTLLLHWLFLARWFLKGFTPLAVP